MFWRNRYQWVSPSILCVLASALVGCAGWKKPQPDPKQLAQVNQQFEERYDFVLDTARLLKTNIKLNVQGPTGVLHPDDAIQRALDHNLTLVSQAESINIAQANLVQAGLLQNPTLGQSGAFYIPLSSGTGPATAFDLEIDEVINDFFTRPHKVAVAKAQQVQAGIDLANQAFGIAQQVQSQYQQLVYITRDGQLQHRIADTYKQAVDEAQAQLKVGMVTRADFNRAVIAYEDSLRQAHHFDTQLEGAARQMNWLMGVQSAPQWELPSNISDPPQVIASLPRTTQVEELAMSHRLDLLRADYDRKIAAASVKLARWGYFPQTTLGADFARDNNRKWTGGPNFSTVLPLFDPGIVAVWLARYQQEQSERTYATLEGQVKQDVRNALNSLQIAAEDVIFYRDVTIPQEQENVKLAQLSFKLGNAQFDDLLNSIREYVGVLQNYEDAIQAYHQALISLESATGLSVERIRRATQGATSQPTTNPLQLINPTGSTTLPTLLPGSWQEPHTPFQLLGSPSSGAESTTLPSNASSAQRHPVTQPSTVPSATQPISP